MNLLDSYRNSPLVASLYDALSADGARVRVTGLSGSLDAVVAAALFSGDPRATHLFIAPDKEEAYYLLNDLATPSNRSTIRIS